MPDVGLLQALMNQAQQVMQQAQASEQSGFQQDQNGLDFLGNMMAQEKPEFEKAADQFAGEFAFAAVQMPAEYQQNLVTQFEAPSQEANGKLQLPLIVLPEVVSADATVEKSLPQSQPEMLLTETANQNHQSLFIQGIRGEVKLADESVTPEFIDPIGDVPSSQKEQAGYVDYVQPHGNVTSDPFQELNADSQSTIRTDGALEVIENQDGVQEFTPSQDGVSFDPESGFDNNSSGETLDLSTPSSESRAPAKQDDKGAIFVGELQSDKIDTQPETNPVISVEAKTGDMKFEGTLKTELPQRPQVMDQIFAKMDFPSLKQKGEQKISIVLDPQELGRVDVELQIDGDKVNAVFKADQQALNYAKDDAHKLLQMLKDQGFNASAQDFQFQERTSESHYAQANLAYGNFSVEETDNPSLERLTQQIYNRSVSGRSYDAVI